MGTLVAPNVALGGRKRGSGWLQTWLWVVANVALCGPKIFYLFVPSRFCKSMQSGAMNCISWHIAHRRKISRIFRLKRRAGVRCLPSVSSGWRRPRIGGARCGTLGARGLRRFRRRRWE